MTYKPTKAYSETLIPDTAYSSDFYDSSTRKYHDTYRAPQSRKNLDLINDSKSLKEYERLNEKINRNKQMIEELRRTNKDTKDNKDLLKNVNHAKTPAFLHLEPKK